MEEQQRLSLASALLAGPDVVLDRPSAGVDLTGKELIRGLIGSVRLRRGSRRASTTHDLADLDQLADRIIILDEGIIVADGSPDELLSSASSDSFRFRGQEGLPLAALSEALGVEVVEASPGHYLVGSPPVPGLVARLTSWLAQHEILVGEIQAGRQRLESVFVLLTSHAESPRRINRISQLAWHGQFEGRASGQTSEPPVGGVKAEAEAEDEQFTPRTQPRPRPINSPGPTEAETLAPCPPRSDPSRVTNDVAQPEQLLVSVFIPLGILVFFSTVPVFETETRHAIDSVAPSVLALAVMSSALVSLGIGTGFERYYGVLKRLGTTPLGRPRWIRETSDGSGNRVSPVAADHSRCIGTGLEPSLGLGAWPSSPRCSLRWRLGESDYYSQGPCPDVEPRCL